MLLSWFFHVSPCLPIAIIWVMIIVWKFWWKIIRYVAYCVVCETSSQWYTHVCDQLLNLHVGLGLDLFLCVLFILGILYVFGSASEGCILVFLAFVVLAFVSQVLANQQIGSEKHLHTRMTCFDKILNQSVFYKVCCVLNYNYRC